MKNTNLSPRLSAPSASAAGDHSVPISIAEASKQLKVSQRTIYRMIEKGILTRIRVLGNNGKNVNFVNGISHINSSQPLKIQLSKLSEESQSEGEKPVNLVDISKDEKIQALRAELEARDVQIAQLIETQKQLSQTIQGLQNQVAVLAQSILEHNGQYREEEKARLDSAKSEAEAKRKKQRGLLTALLGKETRPRGTK